MFLLEVDDVHFRRLQIHGSPGRKKSLKIERLYVTVVFVLFFILRLGRLLLSKIKIARFISLFSGASELFNWMLMK